MDGEGMGWWNTGYWPRVSPEDGCTYLTRSAKGFPDRVCQARADADCAALCLLPVLKRHDLVLHICSYFRPEDGRFWPRLPHVDLGGARVQARRNVLREKKNTYD